MLFWVCQDTGIVTLSADVDTALEYLKPVQVHTYGHLVTYVICADGVR